MGSPKKSQPLTHKLTKRQLEKYLDGLDQRQREYVLGRLEGKSKKDAALNSGWSEAQAKSVRNCGPEKSEKVREAFRRLVQAAIPAEKIVQRLTEGLDANFATVTVLGGVNNGHTEINEFPDIKERREYLKLAAEYAGYHVPKAELDVNEHTNDDPAGRLAELLTRAAARSSSASQPE